jgi:hypothetical protein
MHGGFDGETEQNERKAREAVIGLGGFGFFGGKAEEEREVGNGALG